MFIDFPNISPVALSIGPFDLRWYALAYLVGIISAWILTKKNIKKYDIKITDAQLDDLVFYTTLGIILGGRIGYGCCYGDGYFWRNPLEIFAVWNGGMSFHGGIVGVILGLLYFCKKEKFQFLMITDLVALNISKINETAECLLDFCKDGIAFDALLQRVFERYGLNMTHEQHVLIGSTVRSYLSWLYNRNLLQTDYVQNVQKWIKV